MRRNGSRYRDSQHHTCVFRAEEEDRPGKPPTGTLPGDQLCILHVTVPQSREVYEVTSFKFQPSPQQSDGVMCLDAGM